jgi:hypothetical protein
MLLSAMLKTFVYVVHNKVKWAYWSADVGVHVTLLSSSGVICVIMVAMRLNPEPLYHARIIEYKPHRLDIRPPFLVCLNFTVHLHMGDNICVPGNSPISWTMWLRLYYVLIMNISSSHLMTEIIIKFKSYMTIQQVQGVMLLGSNPVQLVDVSVSFY